MAASPNPVQIYLSEHWTVRESLCKGGRGKLYGLWTHTNNIVVQIAVPNNYRYSTEILKHHYFQLVGAWGPDSDTNFKLNLPFVRVNPYQVESGEETGDNKGHIYFYITKNAEQYLPVKRGEVKVLTETNPFRAALGFPSVKLDKWTKDPLYAKFFEELMKSVQGIKFWLTRKKQRTVDSCLTKTIEGTVMGAPYLLRFPPAFTANLTFEVCKLHDISCWVPLESLDASKAVLVLSMALGAIENRHGETLS